jgi:hypothetical protein
MRGMDDQRAAAIANIQRAIDVSVQLRACLRSNEVIGRKMIKGLEAGLPFSSTVSAAGSEPAVLRKTTNELLSEYEQCRHDMRLAFIEPILEEGFTVSQIGRALGTSRQLAARLAKEAKANDGLA